MSFTTNNVVGDVNSAYIVYSAQFGNRGVCGVMHGTQNARRCVDEMKKVCLGTTSGLWFMRLACIWTNSTTGEDSYADMAGRCYVYGSPARLDLKSHGNGLDAGTPSCMCCMSKQVADRGHSSHGRIRVRRRIQGRTFLARRQLLEIGGGTSRSHHKSMSGLAQMGSTRLD
jgi:hypothetical protein